MQHRWGSNRRTTFPSPLYIILKLWNHFLSFISFDYPILNKKIFPPKYHTSNQFKSKCLPFLSGLVIFDLRLDVSEVFSVSVSSSFLALSGAQEMLIFIHSFVCLFVCSFIRSFIRSIFIFLSQVSLRMVPSQSQVSPRSVPGQSQVSPRSVPGQSQVSPQGLDKALDWKKVCAVSLLVYFRLWLSEEVWAWERAERRLRERKERNKRTAWIYRGQKDRAKKCERWCYKLFKIQMTLQQEFFDGTVHHSLLFLVFTTLPLCFCF